jgi:hypothetical protein
MLNGNLGFSGSNPVIQVAGAQRVIESDPRELFTSGNFATVPTMYIHLDCWLKIVLYIDKFLICSTEGLVRTNKRVPLY